MVFSSGPVLPVASMRCIVDPDREPRGTCGRRAVPGRVPELAVHPNESIEHRSLIVEAADRRLGGGGDTAGLVLIEAHAADDRGGHLEADPIAAPSHVARSSNDVGGRTRRLGLEGGDGAGQRCRGLDDLELGAVGRIERPSRHESGDVDRPEPERCVARRIGETA